jgi:hypothetical protein
MKKYIEDNSKILNFQYQKSIKELSIFFKKNGLDAMEMEYIIQQIKTHLLKKPNFFQEVRKINTSNAANNSLLKYHMCLNIA